MKKNTKLKFNLTNQEGLFQSTIIKNILYSITDHNHNKWEQQVQKKEETQITIVLTNNIEHPLHYLIEKSTMINYSRKINMNIKETIKWGLVVLKLKMI